MSAQIPFTNLLAGRAFASASLLVALSLLGSFAASFRCHARASFGALQYNGAATRQPVVSVIGCWGAGVVRRGAMTKAQTSCGLLWTI